MKNALLVLLGFGMVSCRSVSMDLLLGELPGGKTTETGAFHGSFVIPVDEVRKGAPLYVQAGNTTARFMAVNPRAPFCRISSIRADFDDNELARDLKLNSIRMTRYMGALTENLDQVYLIHENHSFRVGAQTSVSYRNYRHSSLLGGMRFSFEGDLECFLDANRPTTTSLLTIRKLFEIFGFEWIWDAPSV